MSAEPIAVTNVPAPDPSTLTTAQLQREITILREDLASRQLTRERDAASLKELLSVRIDAMEQATGLRIQQIDGLPADTEKQIRHLRELMEEKFTSVATQFKERDTRSEREARDNKLAVDAAFAAQEKQAVAQNESNALAIAKSEKATSETILTNQQLSQATAAAQGKTLDEVKGQVLTILASGVGARDLKTDQRAGNQQWLAVGGLFVGIFGGAMIAIVTKMLGG